MRSGENMKKQFKIAEWIAAALAGRATDKQLRQLEEWKQASGENFALYNRIVSENNRREAGKSLQKFDKAEGWDSLSKRVPVKVKTHVAHSGRWRTFGKYAALLAILASVALMLRDWERYKAEEIATLTEVVPETVSPSGIILKTADGRMVDLQENSGTLAVSKEGIIVQNDGKQLSYPAEENIVADEIAYNEIFVTRGKTYKLGLSDGTIVFLNAMSKMRYPVVFGGGERRIELEGEAYLEVAKDSLHPFIVKTSRMDIRVLGTKFDISAYAEDDKVTTTLLTGVVQALSKDGQIDIRLKPDEQLQFDETSGTASVRTVDASNYIAWTQGRIRYRDIRLEDLMKIICRWYDIQVEYETPDVKDILFGCNFERMDSVNQLIQVFHETGKIRIRQVDKKLVVSKIN